MHVFMQARYTYTSIINLNHVIQNYIFRQETILTCCPFIMLLYILLILTAVVFRLKMAVAHFWDMSASGLGAEYHYVAYSVLITSLGILLYS